MKNALILRNVAVSYGKFDDAANGSDAKRVTILDDFSLTVDEGELVVVLGPSGCGKSTLLGAISGLKRPDAGKILFGEDCFFDAEKKIDQPAEARKIGFVFQQYALWPHMTVAENIGFPLKVRKMRKAAIAERVDAMLAIVDMQGFEDRYPDSLSGGEKQRIALARSLVYEPRLLLLDEPLANLDANLKMTLIREIKRIQQRLGITTIYVTHDQNEAFEIADRIVVMNEGQILQEGSPEAVYFESGDAFVANFIGKNLVFDGARDERPDFLAAMGHEGKILIRPENVLLKEDGGYAGVIVSALFKGERIEYGIDSAGARLVAYGPNDAKLEVGSEVRFEIKRFHAF